MDHERETSRPPPDNGRPKFPDYPVNESQSAERDILQRRIAEEKAHYERGFPVAGHDFRREDHERERGR